MTDALLLATLCCAITAAPPAPEQLTVSPKNHMLDNNDNFSPDGRYLVYDRREETGPGIEHCLYIEMVDIQTGEETLLYAPGVALAFGVGGTTGDEAAPGIGAASFSPVAMEVAFIHGPLVEEVPARGPYAKTNRRGAVVPADGSQRLAWLDWRDVATDRPTLRGAHRGGTHRHEYSGDGARIGFTYDDHLLPRYGRTIGYMEPHPDAPGDATHWFAVLVRPVPEADAKPGDLVRALGDSWVGREGTMRAFIGTVMEKDGSFQDSLFVVDVPKDVAISTADAGTAARYPSPPDGVAVRRITHDWAGGIVRGTLDGDRIAYYGKADDGSTQLFVVPSNGSDRSDDPALRPQQATRLEHGAGPGLRWHPSGDYLACISGNGVVTVDARPGDGFGRIAWLVPPDDGPARSQLVASPDGTRFAWNQPVPTRNAEGSVVKTYAGEDFSQIFVAAFDADDLDWD
jgi:hypothetical protein